MNEIEVSEFVLLESRNWVTPDAAEMPLSDPLVDFKLISLSASGTFVIVHFLFQDAPNQQFLSVVDFSGYRGNGDGAAVLLFEHVRLRLAHDRSWREHAVPIYDGLSVVRLNSGSS